VGTLLVVAGDEVVEPGLLLEEVRRRWLGGFLLERQMGVAAIVGTEAPAAAPVIVMAAVVVYLPASHVVLPKTWD
jgi:hypothetical protein